MTLLRFIYSLAGICILLTALTGCTVGPDYQKPDTALPDQWSVEHGAGAADAVSIDLWWETFNDETLSSLITKADANSLDLRAALSRIDQSRALRAYASGENLPSIDAVGSYTRTRYSGNGLAVMPGEHSLYSAGFDAVWEIDLFGRIRRSVESAQATLERSMEDYNDVRVSLYAEVTRNYIELRTAQARLDNARANIEIQQKTLKLTQNRFEAEIAPELDVAQAKLNLANTESEIPSLRIAETEAINRLAVLIGATPHKLRSELIVPDKLPNVEITPTVGMPAELLRRRPDIRSAERALASQTARVGQAEAARYPSFSLAGTLGFEATNISDIGDWNSRAYGFGPAVRWNLFSGNRLRSLVLAEEALTRQFALAYEAAVLGAVEEVENAMVGFAQEQQRAEALRRSVEAARQSVEMVETLYLNGLTNFQNVLDAQRSLSLQQDRLAISEGLILQRIVAMYKALGGGWEQQQ